MNQPASNPALSTIAVAALKAAVSATCESILASSPDLLFDHADGFWAPIRDAVDTEVSAWIRRHNVAHSSGNRLPAELFQMVLAPLKLQDRLSVARVCTTWKILSQKPHLPDLAISPDPARNGNIGAISGCFWREPDSSRTSFPSTGCF
ncbi:hypothetical protein EXIGLDRAFT_730104 [Exidia glandulosa HHB12029]|uniref:F-box domain-containing protein n=1 Tax=Exidia glandulosa HHB12029 TaxID=1314781 RepID=A0A165LDI3_EXIGL|nr:hypothetical protein EXIGLDRAFT_730104 [Exidia glandulosa HHB12029]